MNKVMGLILCTVLGMSVAAAADGEAEQGKSYEAVHAYIKDIELMTIVVKYSGSSDMDSFKKSEGKSFKKAIAAAGDQQNLVDALKAVRGAEIAFMDHAAFTTRAELAKAVGAVEVELELVE